MSQKLVLSTVLRGPDGRQHDHYDVERDENGTPKQWPEGHRLEGTAKQHYVGPLTLRHVLFAAVDGQYEGEKLGNSDLIKRGKLARKIGNKDHLTVDGAADEKNFTAEEVTTMINCCAKRLIGQPEIFLSVVELLEPDHPDLFPKDPAKTEPVISRA